MFRRKFTVGEVLDDREALLVEGSGKVPLGDSQTNGVRDTLTKGTGGHFDAYANTPR